MNLTRLNYWVIVILFANLIAITFFVYLYPKQWIFIITSTIAWIFTIIQYMIGHKLKNKQIED